MCKHLSGNTASHIGQQTCTSQRCMGSTVKEDSSMVACTSPATCLAVLCSNEGKVNIQSTAYCCEKRLLPQQLIKARRKSHYSLT